MCGAASGTFGAKPSLQRPNAAKIWTLFKAQHGEERAEHRFRWHRNCLTSNWALDCSKYESEACAKEAYYADRNTEIANFPHSARSNVPHACNGAAADVRTWRSAAIEPGAGDRRARGGQQWRMYRRNLSHRVFELGRAWAGINQSASVRMRPVADCGGGKVTREQD